MESSNRPYGHFDERDPNLSIPLHIKEVAINPQSESILFNGLIPAEIRNKIFGYALSEYVKNTGIEDANNEIEPETEVEHNDDADHIAEVAQGGEVAYNDENDRNDENEDDEEMDSDDEMNSDRDYDNYSDEDTWEYSNWADSAESPISPYPKNTHYTRPNYEGMKTVDVALLQTCRRIYLEAYHLPCQNKEIVFYHSRGPPTAAYHGTIYDFSRFKSWQLVLIKEVHLFVQAFWLEGSFVDFAKNDFLSGINTIKITMRRGDWWYWENDVPLALSPQSGTVSANSMYQEWAMERNGTPIPWDAGKWGSAFARMKSLKQLQLEFETSDDKRNELKDIVAHALTWKFPAYSQTEGVEMVLSTNGLEPKWDTWQGPMCYWSENCSYCGQYAKCLVADPPNEGCMQRTKLKEEEKGPLCHVVNLKFNIARKNARD